MKTLARQSPVHFLALIAVATAACSLPCRVFAATAKSPVNAFRTVAATATITTHKLRGNVSMLEGSGGIATDFSGGIVRQLGNE